MVSAMKPKPIPASRITSSRASQWCGTLSPYPSVKKASPLMMMMSLFIGLLCALVSSVTYADVPAAEYLNTVYGNLAVAELAVAVIKSVIIGFLIGIICAYLGLNTVGGSAGVGRAVNQAVVIAFALVFVVDLIINLIALGLYPEMQTVR